MTLRRSIGRRAAQVGGENRRRRRWSVRMRTGTPRWRSARATWRAWSCWPPPPPTRRTSIRTRGGRREPESDTGTGLADRRDGRARRVFRAEDGLVDLLDAAGDALQGVVFLDDAVEPPI